jgi:hypothetical protein
MNRKFIRVNPLKYVYYSIVSFFYYLAELILVKKIDDYKKIPIIINNYNRLGMLKRLIESLEKRGYTNLYIIDNNSSYPPLIEYYKSCVYPVFRLDKNIGEKSLWITGIYKKFRNNYFVYTDPDVVPVDECPDDFLLFFLETMQKHKLARKVGFSLKLDDIPEYNMIRKEIMQYEGHFYDYPRGNLLYRAPIDTTFALYRPWGKVKHANNCIEIYRTAFPYMALHLPWYINSVSPDDEERYYLEHLTRSTYWTTRSKKFMKRKDEN